jgi:hypothetical protein
MSTRRKNARSVARHVPKRRESQNVRRKRKTQKRKQHQKKVMRGGLGPNDIKIYFITRLDEHGSKYVKFIIFRKMNKTGKDPICIFLGRYTTFEDVKDFVCKAFGVSQIDLESFRSMFTDELSEYGLLKNCYIKLSSTQTALKMGSTTYNTISFGNVPSDLENQDIFENTEFSEIKQETSVNKADTLIQNVRSSLTTPQEEMTQEYSWPENKGRLELLIEKKIVCWQAVVNLSYGQGARYLKETPSGIKDLQTINKIGEWANMTKPTEPSVISRNMPSNEELHARYVAFRDSQGYRH